mgnify:CR=1 FL=1
MSEAREVMARTLDPVAWRVKDEGGGLSLTHDRTKALARANTIIAALTAAGYAIRPEKPTEQMVEAALTRLSLSANMIHWIGHDDSARRIIRWALEDALAASPTKKNSADE